MLVAMVVLLATGVVPPAVAGLLAAGAMILLRVLTVEQAYRAINWTTVILIGAMMPLSTAMSQSGAAKHAGRRWSDWSATPVPMRCWPACSCSPASWAS